MMANRWKMVLATAAVLSLAACAGYDDGGNVGLDRPNGIQAQNWDNPRNNNFTSMHNNTRMEISEDIAKAVADMAEVESANVLLTDKNAYVAVVLDNGRGYGKTGPQSGAGDFHDEAAGSQNRVYGDHPANNRLSEREGTTDRMGRRGPAAGAGEDGVTDEIKEKISQKVRAMKPDVRNVYVSANPDFVQRLRGYADRAESGAPLRGLIIEFNTAVERLFPDDGEDR